MVVDAATPSEAVFLATHQPARVLRREFASWMEGGQPVGEDQVLEDFLVADTGGLLLLPIIGDSGSGKSHLVRWLRAKVPKDPAQHLVYIPKFNTSLRGVIHLILEGMEGQDFDEVRLELSRAVDSLNENTAPRELLDRLALRVEFNSSVDQKAKWLMSDAADEEQYRAYLREGLPKLLRDPVFGEKLLAQDGVLRSFVKDALSGRRRGDRDAPFKFVEADLPRAVAELPKASQPAREIYADLWADERLRTVAVKVLNEQLDPAIQALFGMGGNRLSDIMLSVRRALSQRGVELILLIEDFAVLQGIQYELLDAILEPAVREGRQVYCPIRTAMAVTTGYFTNFAETALTRGAWGGHVYSLDVRYGLGRSGVTRQELADFVSGYLNAARVGRTRLEDAYGRRSHLPENEKSWVPNLCDTCPHQETCHSSFGRSADGHGLYPFNAAALDRMVRSRPRFDPREVLGQVLRTTLYEETDSIERGTFPSKAFARRFVNPDLPALPADVEAELTRIDPLNAERRSVLLTFWGGCPEEVVDLPAGIHEAFRIPALGKVPTVHPTGEATESAFEKAEAVDKRNVQEDVPPELRAALREVERWSTGEVQLSQRLARDLRNWIHAAIVSRIDWNDGFWRENSAWSSSTTGLFRSGSIRIEKSLGGAVGGDPSLVVDINVSNESVRFLRALIQLQYFGNWKSVERGSELMRLYKRKIDGWSSAVRRGLETTSSGGSSWDPVPATTTLLLIGARILNLSGATGRSDVDLIRATFEEVLEPTHIERGPLWNRLVQACTTGLTKAADGRDELRERLLERVALAQGIGAPMAVDVQTLLPVLKQVRSTWRPPPIEPEAPSGIKKHRDDLDALLDAAVAEELKRLSDWRDAAVASLEPSVPVTDVATAFNAAAKKSIEEGVFQPPRLRDSYEEATRVFRRTRFSVVEEVSKLLEEKTSSPFGELLASLAEDRSIPMREISDFISQANEILDNSIQRTTVVLDSLASGDGASAVNGISVVISDLIAELAKASDIQP